jgi:predicted DNA-binding transcriptional regulator YafY
VAVGLRTAASSGVAGLGETAVQALVKLEQVLPSRLRHRVNAMRVATVETPGNDVSLEVLTAVATACRDRQRLRFDYSAAYGVPEQRREAEPHQLVEDLDVVVVEPDRDGLGHRPGIALAIRPRPHGRTTNASTWRLISSSQPA